MKLWIRLDVAIASDPNVAELAARLEIPLAEAVGLCTLVWCAIAEHRPNGDLRGISISAIESWGRFAGRKGKPAGSFGRAFLGLFTSDDNASGWQHRQGKLVEKAEKERTRKRRGVSTEEARLRNGTERNATERNVVPLEIKDHSGADTEGQPTVSTPPRVVLPKEAEAFLSMFYEAPAMGDSALKRYRDVRAQLFDALDPKHPGPKIRGGIRAKARSVEHMADELNAVMKDPPNDRDMAIVFLLKRLTNPPKGPSVTEKFKREEQAAIQLEERYHAAAKRAGIQWANENPEPYQTILAEVEAHYRGKSGVIVDMAKTQELTQRCAKECRFPSFETWRESLAQPEKISA